jgi:hypothetical protein
MKRITIRAWTWLEKMKATDTMVYANSPATMNGFLPFLSDCLPKYGSNMVLDKEKAPNMSPIYNPLAPRLWA